VRSAIGLSGRRNLVPTLSCASIVLLHRASAQGLNTPGPPPMPRKGLVTESDGHFRLSPLGTVNRRRYSLSRFVHDPEFVCAQGFERSELRKHSDVGLEPPANVATSTACPGPP